MIQKFWFWLAALLTAYALRLVIREMGEMILAGMFTHPHYETLRQHRITFMNNLDSWGYSYDRGKLRRKE